ncbi:MAG: hypothetical protein AB7T06_17585 [Kofleriaceae bacterium]
MRRGALVCAVAWATMGVASANSSDMKDADYCELYDRLWPQAPISTRLTISQEIADAFTELGDTVNQHVGQLSDGRFALTFDGRRKRAYVRIDATTTERYLVFHFQSDVHFTQGVARVNAKLSLGIAGHVIDLELPDFEMAPAEYRGDRGVEIRLPLFKRYF